MKGSSKRAIDFISIDKARKLTFRNRSLGLKKKTEELAILCGIDACLIIYDQTSSDGCPSEPLLWPSDRQHFQSIVGRSLWHRQGKKCIKTSDGHGLVERMKEQISEPVNYTWDDEPLNDYSGEQLKQLLSACESKFKFFKSRVEFLKRMNGISSQRSVPTMNPNSRPESGTPSTAEYFAPPIPTLLCNRKPIELLDTFSNSGLTMNHKRQPDSGTTEYFAPPIPDDSTYSALLAPTLICHRKPFEPSDDFNDSAPTIIPDTWNYHQK